MKTRIFEGIAAAAVVAFGISAWMERRALKKDFVRLEHEFHHVERRVKGKQ